jgi:Tfp pilus assembly protein FimT
MKLSLLGEGLARLTFSDGSALTTNMRYAGRTLEDEGYGRTVRGFAGAMSRRWYAVEDDTVNNTNNDVSNNSEDNKE